MSQFVTPMKAVGNTTLPTGADWVYELKWDGMRLQVNCSDGAAQMFRSSGGRSTTAFPELEPLADAVDLDARLDGEVVVFDGPRPSFRRLQPRIHDEQPDRRTLDRDPAWFIVFDLLELDGRPTTSLTWADRRRLLETVLPDGPNWRLSPVWDEPDKPWAEVTERGFEGLVAKRRTSPYRQGRRSSDWVKVKYRPRQDFAVLGWIEGSGSLSGQVGSIVVGYRRDGEWIPVGAVGSGLDDRSRELLVNRFIDGTALGEAAEWGAVHWLQPTVVVEVAFGEWEAGQRLRHPTLEGVRNDVDPADVYVEGPAQ